MKSFKKHKITIGLALAVPALILTLEAKSMFTVYVFSDVKGQVVDDGKPVAGATIVRTYEWVWGEKKGQDETKTDATGAFKLPAIKKMMLLGSLFPHEPIIHQTIEIKKDGKSYDAWISTKRDYARNGEIVKYVDGKPQYSPIDLLCDLNAEAKIQKHASAEYYGVGVLR